VVQNLGAYKTVPLLQPTSYAQPQLDANGEPLKDASGNPVTATATVQEQVLPMGMALSLLPFRQRRCARATRCWSKRAMSSPAMGR